jgi:hypothetical protein
MPSCDVNLTSLPPPSILQSWLSLPVGCEVITRAPSRARPPSTSIANPLAADLMVT